MPVLIPLAINIGFYIEYLIREFKNLKSKKETFPVYFQFGLVGLIAVLFWATAFLFGPYLTDWLLARFIIASLVLLAVGIIIFKNLKTKNIKKVFYLVILFMMSLGFLAVPMTKVQTQANYKPISELQNNSLPLYHIDYVAPEVIYNYGDKIPSLKTDEGYAVPNEDQFRLLTNKVKPDTIETLSKLYKIEFIETYDLNFSDKDTRGYKNRLVNQLYKLTRK